MKESPTLPLQHAPYQALPSCYHCSEECPNEHLHIDDKYFCCEGCKMVYEILNTNDLCQYYSIQDGPGISVTKQRDARAYAWLDDDEVRNKLVRYSDGHTAKVDFLLPQVHCASCIWLLEHLYRLDAGITHSKVNFLKKQVSIQFLEQETNLRQIAAMLSSIGYAPEINLGDVSDNPNPKAIDRSLYYKIGLAGFAFGNIMLLSFPEYLGLNKAADLWFFKVFGYLNLILATPVLLYSAQDYLRSAWTGLKHRHLNIDVPLSLGIIVLFGRSAWEILNGTGAGYLDSFAGLIFFLLAGKWFQQKTYHQLSFDRDYKSYFPVAATLKYADHTETTVPIQKLEPGDIILVRQNELIPADGILIRGEAQVDYSFVTGEADPVQVGNGQQIYAGGKQLGQVIEITLTRKVSTSYLTQLWNDESFKTQGMGQVSELADRAGRYFTAIILGVAFVAFGWQAFIAHDIHTAINAFSAVLIIACPCAVALSIPFTLGNILRLLGRNKFYIKNTAAIEALAAVDKAVFDKTGTITNIAQNSVQFKACKDQNMQLSESERIAVKSLTRQSNHPLSRQIFESLSETPIEQLYEFQDFVGKGISGTVGSKQLRLGSARFVNADESLQTGVYLEINGQLRGYFNIKSRYRFGLQDLLSYLKKEKIDCSLLSGDNDREAAFLKPLFPDKETLLFSQSPQNKLDYIKNLRDSGHKVLMFGDGLNDAGALQQSDMGIVVTENTNNFTPACDAILHADAFERLPQFFELAKWGIITVNRAYLLAAVYNAVGLSYAISGALSPIVAAILMPLSSITIVLFGVGMGHWKAWKLGLLKEEF